MDTLAIPRGDIQHPVRQLAAEIRPLVGVDEFHLLAAPVRRDPQRSTEQGMPRVSDARRPKPECRVSLGWRASRGRRRSRYRRNPSRTPWAPGPRALASYAEFHSFRRDLHPNSAGRANHMGRISCGGCSGPHFWFRLMQDPHRSLSDPYLDDPGPASAARHTGRVPCVTSKSGHGRGPNGSARRRNSRSG
jgi:hypothetical protein